MHAREGSGSDSLASTVDRLGLRIVDAALAPSRWPTPVLFVVLSTVALLPYAFHADFEFRADDWVLIARGLETGLWEGLVRNFTRPFADTWIIEFYRPLFTFSFCLEGHLFGDRALLYGAVNGAWHAGSVWFAFLVSRRLLGSRTAFLATVLFCSSPWTVNNVMWLAGRCGAASGFFTWLGVWLYLRAVDADRSRLPWGAFIAMTVGVFYRETTLFLPVLAALFDIAERRFDRRSMARWVFLGSPFIFYLLVKRLVLGSWIGGYARLTELRGPLAPHATEGQFASELAWAVLDLFAPGKGDGSTHFDSLRIVSVVVAALILTAGFIGGTWRRREFWIPALFGIVNAVPLLAVDRFVHAGTAQRWYVVMWSVSCILAATMSVTKRPGLVGLLVLLLAACGFVRLDDHLVSYDDSAALSRTIRRTVAEHPGRDVIVYNVRPTVGPAAFFTLGLGQTRLPPFGNGGPAVYPIVATQRFGPALADQVPLGPWLASRREDVSVLWTDYDTGRVIAVPKGSFAAIMADFASRPALRVLSPASTDVGVVEDLELVVDVTGFERIDVHLMTTSAHLHFSRYAGQTYATARFADGVYRERLARMIEYAAFMPGPSDGRCWLWLAAFRGQTSDESAAAFSGFYELTARGGQGRPDDRR